MLENFTSSKWIRQPLGAIDPGYRYILQDHHNGEGQTSRIVIKHGNKVVPWTLDKQQAAKKSHNTAAHCGKYKIIQVTHCHLKVAQHHHNYNIHRKNKKKPGALTCEDLFPNFESIQNGCGNASHGANHAAQAQVYQHEEKHDRPEGRTGEMCHGLGEGNKSQTGALNRLMREKKQCYYRLNK